MLRRLGFIGAGEIARHHARAALSLGAEIAVVCTARHDSPNLDAFRHIAPSAEWCAGVDIVLECRDIDGVVVSLPWNETPKHLARLLLIDKPVLIEKPLALRSEDIPEAWIGDKRVAFNRRFYEPVVSLKERIDRGGLVSAEVTINDSESRLVDTMGEAIRPNLRAYHAVHMFDLVRWLFAVDFGDISLARRDIMVLQARREGMGPILVNVHRDMPVTWSIRCYFGDNTLWALNPLEQLAIYQGMKVSEVAHGLRSHAPVCIKRIDAPTFRKPGFLGQMRAFLHGDLGPTPTDNLHALKLIEALA